MTNDARQPQLRHPHELERFRRRRISFTSRAHQHTSLLLLGRIATMTIYGYLLALCVLHRNVWGTTAFVHQAPKSLTFKGLSSTEKRAPCFAYAGSLPGDVGSGLASSPDKPVKVQGGSLRTWPFTSISIDRVQVVLKTEGRPLDADIELWQGPDNTPQKMRVYSEDGSVRPFSCVIETPRGPTTVAIRNIAQMEFPMEAYVLTDESGSGSSGPLAITDSNDMNAPMIIQGGALKTYPFDNSIKSVQILLKTDGRPLNARVELLQGPNNIKQVTELYTEDGMERPFFAVIDSPGSGNVVRVVNTAPLEFPLTAWVEPFETW